MADWKIVQGHCLDVLRTMPDESVHCAVTSPPYLLGPSIVRRSRKYLERRLKVPA
jgi:DNA modification methylase